MNFWPCRKLSGSWPKLNDEPKSAWAACKRRSLLWPKLNDEPKSVWAAWKSAWAVWKSAWAAWKRQIAALAEAQRRTEEQVRALAAAQESFARRQEWLTTVVSDLINTVGELTTTVRELTATVGNLKTTVGDLKGRVLEGTYRDKASSYFGPLLRRLRVVDPYTLEDTLRRHLSPEEFYDVLLLDLLLCGQPREQPRIPDLWLAVEISAVVDQGDVERVRRRATYLRRAGYRVIPLVAGERATLGAEDEARRHQVAVMQDGRVFLWQEALRAWIENA